MKLLHIDSSILGSASVSRELSAAAVAKLRAVHPDLEIDYLDVAAAPFDHLTLGNMPMGDIAQENADGHAALAQFLAADVVVIGAPMYNFTIPSQLKAWLDRILIAGKTFRYGPSGAEGLVPGKRVILAISRGNFYGEGMPAADSEYLETYLRAVFGFIGIVPEVVAADGVKAGPAHRSAALLAAHERIAALVG